MPGFASFSEGNEKSLKIKKIWKKEKIDTEISFIYPQLIERALQLIKKKRLDDPKQSKEVIDLTNHHLKSNENIQPSSEIHNNKFLVSLSTNNGIPFQTNGEMNKKEESAKQTTEPPSQFKVAPEKAAVVSPKNNYLKQIPHPQLAPNEKDYMNSAVLEKKISNTEKQYVYKVFSGKFIIYTFSSACIKCLEEIISITKLFKNLSFKLFYSKVYDNKGININYFEHLTDHEIKDSFYYKGNCVKKADNYLSDRKKEDFNTDTDNNSFNSFFQCVQKKYEEIITGKIKLNNIEFKSIPLRKDIGTFYFDITKFRYNRRYY